MEWKMKFVNGQMIALLGLAAMLLFAGPDGQARESDADIGEVTFSGDEALLPLQAREMHPRLLVDLGDDTQYAFIVDTGASVNVIDTTVAEALGYEVVGETEIGAPGGPQIPAQIVKVPLARIGDVTIVDAEFVTMDILGFSGGQTHGVIGIGLFSDYLLTFDRGAGHIKLTRGSLTADRPSVVAYDSADSQIEIDISVVGTPAVAHIDTGSMGKFMLPGEMMAVLPVQQSESGMKAKLVGGERDIKLGQLQGNIQFAGMTFDNPDIAFMTPSTGSGNIGSGILADYLVSIDQKNHLIAFDEPADGGVAAKAGKPRRLGVQFKGMSGGGVMTIGAVGPGSLGEQAGLQSDDSLLAINGKSMDQYDMPALGALIGGFETLHLDIERNGEPISIEIK
jgi:predicted aspartyl protease